MKRAIAVFAALALSMGLASAALADQISDQLNQGVKLYQEGKVSQAIRRSSSLWPR